MKKLEEVNVEELGGATGGRGRCGCNGNNNNDNNNNDNNNMMMMLLLTTVLGANKQDSGTRTVSRRRTR